MHNTDPVLVKARNHHHCTWCGEGIAPGEMYHRWTTFDDSAFVSKMHDECKDAAWEECRENGGEYIAFDNERPSKGIDHE